jgi:hypothetical protein
MVDGSIQERRRLNATKIRAPEGCLSRFSVAPFVEREK